MIFLVVLLPIDFSFRNFQSFPFCKKKNFLYVNAFSNTFLLSLLQHYAVPVPPASVNHSIVDFAVASHIRHLPPPKHPLALEPVLSLYVYKLCNVTGVYMLNNIPLSYLKTFRCRTARSWLLSESGNVVVLLAVQGHRALLTSCLLEYLVCSYSMDCLYIRYSDDGYILVLFFYISVARGLVINFLVYSCNWPLDGQEWKWKWCKSIRSAVNRITSMFLEM